MIKKVKLSNFRNFHTKILDFSENITVISGRNAAGKTNILESLFLLSTGKSFKAKKEIDVIKYKEELARVTGSHFAESSQDDPLSLEVIITEGRNGWPRKKMMVNGVPKRLIDFAGNFKTVLFGPWDMDLVSQSPSLRRRFLDTVLSQVDREYRRSILSYEKGIRQRNKLLYRIREERLSTHQLIFWNQLLVKNGDYITKKRTEFIDFANAHPNLNGQEFSLEYDKSIISEGRLDQYKNEEIAAATTLVGPHRDDFSFKEGFRDLASFGSRGEQRMGILWLKIAELNFIATNTERQDGLMTKIIPNVKYDDNRQSRLKIEDATGVNPWSFIEKETIFENTKETARPTLLLDDIFSELDHNHRDVVMDFAQKQQTIITTAEEHFLEGMEGFDIATLE